MITRWPGAPRESGRPAVAAAANAPPPAEPRTALRTFFLLAFGCSWAAWLPVAAASRGLLVLPAAPALDRLGAFGPTLAALALTFRACGVRGVRRLLHGLRLWRVAPGWYAFALTTPAGALPGRDGPPRPAGR